MDRLQISIANVHCNDCEESIKKVISNHLSLQTSNSRSGVGSQSGGASGDAKKKVSLLLQGSELHLVSYESNLLNSYIKRILKDLDKSGYDVLSWELFQDENLTLGDQHVLKTANNQSKVDSQTREANSNLIFKFFKVASEYREKRKHKHHLKNCKSCRDKESQPKPKAHDSSLEGASDSDSTAVEVVTATKEYRAVLSIGGMTCVACANAVSQTIQSDLLNHNLKIADNNETFSVNLLANTAVIILPNKQLINEIITSIENSGYDANLVEILPVERAIYYKLTAVLGGITCVACANSINTAVDKLPIVLESNVNVVSKTGIFIIESDRQETINTLKEAIEDTGFEFQLVNIEKINFTSAKIKSRSINLKIDGMHCAHCPSVINEYLQSFGEAVVIKDPITLNHPYIKFTYLPSENLNIRKIMYGLNHLSTRMNAISSVDETGSDTDGDDEQTQNTGDFFHCQLIHPVSLDEHLRKLAKAETLRIAKRLAIAVAFTIPTFIFGVVAMSLLPKHNSFRKWVEEPIWKGNVSRNTWILFILSTPVYFFAADIFHRKALKELKALWFVKNSFGKRLFRFGSMNLLMTLGTSVAYFASIALLALSAQTKRESQGYSTTYFDSVVFLSFFLLIGRLLESYSKAKTTNAIASLSGLKPSLATLVEATQANDETTKYGNDEQIGVDYLEINDLIRVTPGDSPPVDCIIIDGTSQFDESALTGESNPVKHVSGHQIFAGTVNVGNNSVVAKVSALDGGSLIDQIVDTVRNGQLRKSPIERTADILTSYFVPVITLIALITWIVWLSLGVSGSLPSSYLDIDVGGWVVWSLEFAIAVFVVACPCGIGLAAPTALFVGAGLAAKNGILAKGGGVAFQDGANINVVCFDKTGTLTHGDLRVTNFAFNQDYKEKITILKTIALQVTRDLELSSNHPISKAVKSFIQKYCEEQNIELSQNKVPKVENIPGKGLKGEIVLDDKSTHHKNNEWIDLNPTEVILGNEALMKDNEIELNKAQQSLLNKWKSESKSVIIIALKCSSIFEVEKYVPILFMAARDEIRPETKDVVSKLRERHIQTWMISGDNETTANAIAKEIGIENVVSEVLPDEKASKVKWLQQSSIPGKQAVVAMVGDGINDAPALASADVGIALASGSDLAVTSSDFILLNKTHPLIALLVLLELSKKVFNRVKFNFGWALVYNSIGIPIAAGVIYPYNNSRLNPVWASAAMAASSISVVLSSLALRLYKPSTISLEKSSTMDSAPEETIF